MADRLRVLVLNKISAAGLARLPAERYRVGTDITDPDAILLRSADLHGTPIAASVRAVARAGAGTNNIPVAAMSARGVPVFNAPGANANAVKELVLAAMLIASRNLAPALGFVDALDVASPDLEAAVEDGKKAYAGRELQGRTLGIVGLGRIGCLVAEAAIGLGMKVLGFDPEITVDAAWSLPSQVKRSASVDEVLAGADFVTLHVPLLPSTRDLVGPANIGRMKPDAVLMNFSREGVVSNAAVVQALAAKRLGGYVCDFPSPELHRQRGVVTLPHLGASTAEAEENCALMVVDQLRAYLEDGEIVNAVNFPSVRMARDSAFRVAIANSNVPNMLGQISTTMAQAGLNIHNMLNKSRGEMAYTLVDVDSAVGAEVLDALAAIPGVLAVRYLPAGPTAG
ncbi:MAG: phosphoglycerate dehydrogenase [Burkholderiales bacterium]|nr:phosphoglycerate dehydrogenase [Burkholderiales bacterium]